ALVEHLLGHLLAHLVERRRFGHAAFLELDQVPAELALYRLGQLALFERESGFLELGNHHAGREEPEIAAIGGGAVGAVLGGGVEIAAAFDLGADIVGFLFGLDEDMAGPHFGLGGELGGQFVIGGLDGLFGHFGLDDLVEEFAAKRLLFEIGEAAGEFLGVGK